MPDLDRATVLDDLASAAGTTSDDIDPGEAFIDLGIDSVRLMRLVDTWRSRGADVAFADLAAAETVEDALRVLTAA